MHSTFRLGKIGGIEIGIHYSWFAVLLLVTWSLATGFLPSQHRFDGWSTATYWGTAVVAALLLFVSVIIHELAHSLVARARGFRVAGITLFLLGGVSSLQAEARHAKDEFIIAVVGPATSLVLGGILWLVDLSVQGTASPASAVLSYLWFINLVLAAFNMVPAFPLDGGRVLRSVVWGATGSLEKGTRIASWGGQLAGVLLIMGGVWLVLQGNYLAGVWFGFIGWFLQGAASAARRDMEEGTGIGNPVVGEVMDRRSDIAGPEMTIADAVYGHLLHNGTRALPVCRYGRLIGIFTLADIEGTPREDWGSLTVMDRMTPVPLRSLEPDDDLGRAVDLLAEHSLNQAPVVEGDRLVGMLDRADIIQHLHHRKQRRVPRWPRSAGDIGR